MINLQEVRMQISLILIEHVNRQSKKKKISYRQQIGIRFFVANLNLVSSVITDRGSVLFELTT